MRVALLHPLPDASRWSMNLYHQELAKAMKGLLKGDEEVFCFPPAEEDLEWQADTAAFLGRLKRYQQQYFLLGSKAAHLKADLFHITDHGYGHLIPFISRRGKIIVTFHDALLPNLGKRNLPVRDRPYTAILAQQYSLRCMKKAVRIITVSEFAKKEFLRFCDYSPEDVLPIHDGVGGNFFQPVSEDRLQAFQRKWDLEQKTVILSTGRTNAHKNMEGTLRTFHYFKQHFCPEAVLLKFGEKFMPAQYNLIRSLSLEPSLRYLGPIENADVSLVYQASHALLFLSWYEGFGFPALEAMASGIPVIASDRGSLPEVVGEGGILVNPENIEQAARALHTVCADVKLRASLLDKGRKRACQFSWLKTAEKTLEVYREVYGK